MPGLLKYFVANAAASVPASIAFASSVFAVSSPSTGMFDNIHALISSLYTKGSPCLVFTTAPSTGAVFTTGSSALVSICTSGSASGIGPVRSFFISVE